MVSREQVVQTSHAPLLLSKREMIPDGIATAAKEIELHTAPKDPAP